MTARSEPLSVGLARWASALRYDDLPQTVVHAAKRTLLDYLGVVIAGSGTEIARTVVDCLVATEERGSASVIGTRQRMSPMDATLANGTAASALELDGGHSQASMHIMAVCAPAILAAAQARNSGGKDIILATAVACEVASRIGVAASGAVTRGFNGTSLLGAFGAAIGVAKILGSEVKATTHALGLAGTNAGGMYGVAGGWLDGWSISVGRTGREGYLCAVLAERGIAGPSDILDGPKGIGALYNGGPFDRDVVLAGLGREWLMSGMYVKIYPCCRILHSTIEAGISLRQKIGKETERIERIVIETSAASAQLANKNVDSMLDAQFSLPYGVAAALVFGPPRLEHFEESARRHPAVLRLVDRVEVVQSDDPDIADRRFPARVRVVTDTDTTVATVLEPSGGADNPVSDANLNDKFSLLVEPAIGGEIAGRIRETVWDLNGEDNGSRLFTLVSDLPVKTGQAVCQR